VGVVLGASVLLGAVADPAPDDQVAIRRAAGGDGHLVVGSEDVGRQDVVSWPVSPAWAYVAVHRAVLGDDRSAALALGVVARQVGRAGLAASLTPSLVFGAA